MKFLSLLARVKMFKKIAMKIVSSSERDDDGKAKKPDNLSAHFKFFHSRVSFRRRVSPSTSFAVASCRL